MITVTVVQILALHVTEMQTTAMDDRKAKAEAQFQLKNCRLESSDIFSLGGFVGMASAVMVSNVERMDEYVSSLQR